MPEKAAPTPHGSPQPAMCASDVDLVIVPPGASTGAPLAQHALSSVAVDAPVTIVPPGASAGATPSVQRDDIAAMNADVSGSGSIMGVLRANRGR